ncbi:unnamed protein product [Cuscuta europaea]|uniref:DUF4283 domain-containing protein n=1 Tax=Cuscuta europaea TaxID=41803 RepID=A0A9P0Z7W6_CUSEU|nr:unnamed protein product [Cuscuta europaea]
MIEMWGYCLVGHFTGRFPGLKAVHDLKATWGVKCLVRSHDKEWVIFKFQNEVDRTKVLHEGPYMVFGKLLMLKELSDDFSFEDAEFLKVPIWIKFPKLPMKLWNDEAMSEVASMVGIPITTDKITQERTNNDYARVLIEVDVSKPPPLSFPIRLPSRKVFKQNVVYETFPNFCFHCKQYGHNPFICKILAKRGDGEINKDKLVDESHSIVGNIGKDKGAANCLRAASPILTVQGGNPTGSRKQETAQGAGKVAEVAATDALPVQEPADGVTTVKNMQETAQGAGNAAELAATDIQSNQAGGQFVNQGASAVIKLADQGPSLDVGERIVMEKKDVKLDDVVIKCEVINGKTLKLVVKPFKSVHANVIRVDNFLRLTDDLNRKGLTFTVECLEGLPGVTKKKGEVRFDSKFTKPFRFFLSCQNRET